jgi:hypothetical protein
MVLDYEVMDMELYIVINHTHDGDIIVGVTDDLVKAETVKKSNESYVILKRKLHEMHIDGVVNL